MDWHVNSESVVADRIRAPNLSSGAFIQQSLGSNPSRYTICVLEQDTKP